MITCLLSIINKRDLLEKSLQSKPIRPTRCIYPTIGIGSYLVVERCMSHHTMTSRVLLTFGGSPLDGKGDSTETSVV